MAKQTINTGAAANDGNGDGFRTAMTKANDNFTELYDGLAAVPEGAAEATAAEVQAGTETAKFISPDKLFDASAPQALTSSSGAVAINMGAGINFELTLTEASDMNNPTNAKPGQSGTMLFTQDGTGGWALTWDSNWSLIGDAPTLNTTAGAVELFGYFVRSSTDIEYWYVGPKA